MNIRHRSRLLAAVATIAALVAVPLGAPTAAVAAVAADGATRPIALTKGHIDLFEVTYDTASGGLALRVKDDTGLYESGAQYRDPGDVTIWVDSALAATDVSGVPANLAFLKTDGTTAWLLPQTQNQDLPWPGWSTERLGASLPAGVQLPTTGSPVQLAFGIQGPGHVFTWQTGAFGAVTGAYINTTDATPDVIPVAANAHVHTNWAFTALGDYTMTVTPTATTTGGETITGPAASYHVHVGPAADATPTVATAPAITGSGTVGEPLSLDTGQWSPRPHQLAAQWLRDGTAIDGATGTDYTPVDADAGHAISARVTARVGTVSTTADSAAVAAHTASEGGGTVTVSGAVWDDTDGDGARGAGEAGIPDLQLAVLDASMSPILDADGAAPLLATTDADGAYAFSALPPLSSGEQYTVFLIQAPDGYTSTTGLEQAEGGYFRTTTADLSVAGASDTAVDFALAAGDSEPGDGGGDDGDDGDWTVLPVEHADMLYPEFDTAADGTQSLRLRAEVDTYQPMDWDDLVVWNTDAIKETLPEHYASSADYSFIGPEGSTVYRSRAEGPTYDTTTADPNDGSPWMGAAAQSPTLDLLQPNHPFSFRLDAVTGYDGGAAPGDVVMWMSGFGTAGAESTGQTLFSTVKGLPQAWVLGKGKHTHFNWTFTQPGVYCMAFSVQTEMPDGSRQATRGILTQIVGSQYDPTTIEPCGRHLTYPEQPAKQVKTSNQPAPIVSGDGNAAFALALDNQQHLRATYNQEPTYGDGPSTAYSIDDVILYGKADINYPYRFSVGSRGTRNISWDTVQIADTALDGDVTWSIDSIEGPGDLQVTSSGEWSGQKFDTANDVTSRTLWAGSSGNDDYPRWQVTRPGKYCVAMTWTATTAAGTTVSDHHILTLVADGPLDPNDYDPYYADNGKDGPYAGDVWRAADHGALDQTCAQGGRPTSADEVPIPGSDDDNPPADDATWDVPNWSATDSGATILNDGHIDIASTLDGGVLDTQVKDTTDEGQTHATHDGASWHDTDDVVLQVLPDAQTAIPADDTYRFLGTAGKPVWIVSETQQEGLLWPGWSTETIPVNATRTGVTWTLDRISGPGEFALFKGGQTLGSVDVLYDTRDGVTAPDSFEIPKNSHVHGSWAFGAEGTYCLGFTRSTTLTDGTPARDDFTLAVAVGRVDVKKIDPAACFTDTGEPDTQDITPVPESQLTGATSGDVQVLDNVTGFYPGQLTTVQVGASHAGQWVSVWLHSTPTWLGWAQVGSSGAIQVRLPADAAVGSHKLVVKTQPGDLIGWDVLALVAPPHDGSGGGDGGGNGGGDTTTPPPGCTSTTTIISAGHLDYSTQVVGGKLESLIGDSSSGTEVFREPSKTVLWLKGSSKATLTAGYEQIGPAGSSVYLVPQTQNPDLIWLGWSTERINASTVSSPVTWTLTDVDGPGTVKVFLQGEFAGIGSMVFDGTGSYEIRTGVHAHANWAFSAPGIYRLHLTQSATLAGGQASSDSEVLTIVVGDVDPTTTVPGGADCANTNPADTSGTIPAGGTGTVADTGTGPAAQAAVCTPSGVTVISSGHLDWNTQVVGGKLESLIGDDSTGTRVYRQPASTVLWLKPASKVTLPASVPQVGTAGSAVWQVPQTQDSDLIWLGWSTELLNAANTSGPVTWSLTKVDGPGTVKVYTVGTFGGVQQMVFDGTGSTTIPLGSHVHANWAFGAQGVYRLHFTQTATLAGGQRSSDSEVLTIAVGDVDPTTVAAGSGCGVVSQAALTGDQTLDAAEQSAAQARQDAAAAAAGVLPGGTTAAGPGTSDVVAVLSGSDGQVRLLLTVLGALLLIGAAGTGALWWRRRSLVGGAVVGRS